MIEFSPDFEPEAHACSFYWTYLGMEGHVDFGSSGAYVDLRSTCHSARILRRRWGWTYCDECEERDPALDSVPHLDTFLGLIEESEVREWLEKLGEERVEPLQGVLLASESAARLIRIQEGVNWRWSEIEEALEDQDWKNLEEIQKEIIQSA